MGLRVEIKQTSTGGVSVLDRLKNARTGGSTPVGKQFEGRVGNYMWADRGKPTKYTGAHGAILEHGRSTGWDIPIHDTRLKKLKAWVPGVGWKYPKVAHHGPVVGKHFVREIVTKYEELLASQGGIGFILSASGASLQAVSLSWLELSKDVFKTILDGHITALKAAISENTPEEKYPREEFGKSLDKEEYRNKRSRWYIPLPWRIEQGQLRDKYLAWKVKVRKMR